MKLLSLIFIFAIIVIVESSSHSEAPGTAKSPQSDPTDFYMFRSYESGREDFITFLVNVQPLQNPFGGPNYFSLSDDHFYEIYVDNDGDAVEDITFQFYAGNRLAGELRNDSDIPDEDDCDDAPEPSELKHEGFRIPVGDNGNSTLIPLKTYDPITAGNNAGLNFYEWYQLNYIEGGRDGPQVPITNGTGGTNFVKPFDNAGTKTFPDYDSYANQYIYDIDIPNCGTQGRVFVGQRAESFGVNLGGIFDLVNFNPITTTTGAIEEDETNNVLRNLNVITFALEVPIACLTDGDDVIGAWTASRKLKHNGTDHVAGRQVARLGQPLVNEVFIGLRDKGKFNQAQPSEDASPVNSFQNYVLYPSLPAIINALFLDFVNGELGASLTDIAPTVPRTDLLTIFLTGVPGLNQPAGVVPSEMLRLNTATGVTAAGSQHRYGVLFGDAAGFPNGRRPGDDVIDIALMAAMGKACFLELGIGCTGADAPAGAFNLTDGAPVEESQFDTSFPYLKTPIGGYPKVPQFPPGGADCCPRILPGSNPELHAFNAVKKYYPSIVGSATDICEVQGVRCYANGAVKKINFNNLPLNAILPTDFAYLPSLISLSIKNSGLTGTIPRDYMLNENLQTLDLSANEFQGNIPTLFGQSTTLKNLRLNNNNLIGTIPTELGSITSLKALYLQNNRLTGTIPSELGQLSNLRKLKLQDNILDPNLPTEVSNLSLSFLQVLDQDQI